MTQNKDNKKNKADQASEKRNTGQPREENLAVELFSELRQKRLEKNIELKEIAKVTRIQLKYLQALEAGDLDKIPQVYDKLFFKSYLSMLNLDDAEKYVEKFRGIRHTRRPQLTTTIRRIQTVETDPRMAGIMKRIYIGLPILILIAIIALLVYNTTGVDTVDDNNVQEIAVQDIVKELQNEAIADSTEKNIQHAATTDSVMVAISATERTWLRAVKDRADTSEYMLQPDNRVNIRADSVVVFQVGNPSGVRFRVNGRDAGIMGKQGEVITYLKITTQGITERRVKSLAKKEPDNDSLNVN